MLFPSRPLLTLPSFYARYFSGGGCTFNLCAHRQQEEGFRGPEGHPEGGRGPSDEKGGGLVGLGMSVLELIAVDGLAGFGGVRAWSKFQSGNRQPGVRYTAADIADHDLGTELDPCDR